MNKKAIAILGGIFILIVIVLGVLIYLKSRTPASDTSNNTNTVVETPPVVEETPPTDSTPTPTPTSPNQAVRLTDEPVVSPILFFNQKGISYFISSGHLYQTDLTINNGSALLSNKKELSIAQKPGINRIIWPPSGDGFIAETGTPTNPLWSFYDSKNAKYVDLPKQTFSIDWMPKGDKIVYNWLDNGKSTLNMSNPDGSGHKTITTFFKPDNIVRVSPDGNNIAFFSSQSADTTKNPITIVSTDGKNFKTVVVDGYNTGVLWSPDSKKFLFTRLDGSSGKYGLWMADVATSQVKNLGVFTTITKAVWTKDSTMVYAGVSTGGSSGSTQDIFYKLTIASAEQKQFDPGIPVDAQNLFLDSNQTMLFFRNGQDNSLYYIPIQ